MATKRYFEDREHAQEYKKYRSEIPSAIVRRIVTFVEESHTLSNSIAIDVGCGSGQSTLPLAPFFKQIIGMDISLEQITAVGHDKPSNVSFTVGSSDEFPLPNHHVHLVTAVNAVHWFDLDKFFQEVDRILVPKGVLALIRGTPVIEIAGCEEATMKLFHDLMHSCNDYWDQAELVKDFSYKTLTIPYRMKVRDESVITEDEVTLKYIINRVKTLSGIAKLLKENPNYGNKILAEYESNMLKAVGSPNASLDDVNVILKRQFVLLMGRKP